MKRVRVLVSGRVQGVYFRASMRAEAERLGVAGWVQNLADGRVEAVLSGADGPVDALVGWCHKGPDGARVTSVSARAEPADEPLAGFTVKR